MRTIALALVSVVFSLTVLVQPARAQPTPDTTYHIYTGQGEPAVLRDITDAMASADVVFIGEVHSDPTAHALQHDLLTAAHHQHGHTDSTAGRPVTLSLEMFERDVQPVLDEYLAGLITEEHFLASSRPWSNYADAYRPLVEYAKAHDLDVLAANAPRRYVNRVSRLGVASLDSLPATATQWLPPLPPPPPSDAYRAKWNALMRSAMAQHGADTTSSPHGAPPDSSANDAGVAAAHGAHHGAMMQNMLRAQALWDATMAHTIARHQMNTPDAFVLHVTGGFHVSGGTGTPEQLAHYRPSARSLVVSIRPADDVTAFDIDEHTGLGDFVILTDAERVPDSVAPPDS
jgi:uncharacterized iron-regulated protein